ncbi:DUF418 domain-containing protein [Blastomonas sp.]|uniref:DUF418 domain-containing protein n=1 Tax=Blastomonas sp. TaxID=1909299 RepID=UPI0035940C16
MQTTDRHLSLDALRGFAVMGILLLNITAFAMPEAAYINPAAWGGTDPLNIGVWTANFVLFDGKMRGLFSVLFGASMLLVTQRAEASGQNPRALHLNRMFWLFVIGSAHFLLIWWGDILMLYAMTGTIALLFVGKDIRQLLRWAAGLFLLSFLLNAAILAACYWLQVAAQAPDASAETLEAYAEMIGELGAPDTATLQDNVDLYRGPYAGVLAEAASLYLPGIKASLFLYTADTLAMMLIGMAMLKSGFALGLWAPRLYRKIASRGLLLGLPGMAALAAWVIISGFDPLTTFGAFALWSLPFRVALTVAWAALLMLLIVNHAAHPLIVRVAAAGRAAFSNYLGTSLLMTFIFNGWGLGLFGSVDRITAILIVFGAWALMLLWSKPWLSRYRFGPMEWLWRSLARRKPQPMRLR